MSGLYTVYIGVEKCRSTVRKRSPSPPNCSLLCDRSIWIVLSPDWSIRQIPSFGLALPVQLFIVSSMLLKKRRFLFAKNNRHHFVKRMVFQKCYIISIQPNKR